MGEFNVRDAFAFSFDGIDEIGPQERDVVSFGFLELRVLVDGFVFLVYWIECPTIAPADVERALGPVIIRTELMFLGVVAAKLAMLPDAGEFLEVVNRDLMAGSIAGLLLFVEDRRAAYRTSAR